jgi:hypothetical protein
MSSFPKDIFELDDKQLIHIKRYSRIESKSSIIDALQYLTSIDVKDSDDDNW